jgi:hypothetical protein
MPSQQFILDRQRGKQGQHYLAEMLRSWGEEVEEVEDGFFQDYDLRIKRNGRTIEVKHDYKFSQTSNFCLELEALFHSKADLLAIVTDNPRTVYLTPLQPALTLGHSWPRKKKVGEFQLEAALIPKQDFINKLNPEVLTTNQ